MAGPAERKTVNKMNAEQFKKKRELYNAFNDARKDFSNDEKA